MSKTVLALKTMPALPVEAETITPDTLMGLSLGEIGLLPLRMGRESLFLGDLFNVQGTVGPHIVLQGDLHLFRRIGEGMSTGKIEVHGPVGMHTGACMRGGEIQVFGPAGDWVGAEMQGGVIAVSESAGHHAGGVYPGSRGGMTGGAILVSGAVGANAGERMRRGILAAGGPALGFAGANMLAGTIFIGGPAGPGAGGGMVRGTIILGESQQFLPTFSFDCVFQPAFLRVFGRYLNSLGWTRPGPAFFDGVFRRYSGDMAEGGKGEVLCPQMTAWI